MKIEPDWLGDMIALVLGRKPDPALLAVAARLLEQREEVLPWLVLRQSAFADDPELLGRLKTLAAAGNRPSPHRPAGQELAPEAIELNRQVEATLRALIADNLAGQDRADTLGAILHRHNQTLPGGPTYDFRRRIMETAPEPDQGALPRT